MTTMQLIGKVANKRGTFRKELKELAHDYEGNYVFECQNSAGSSFVIIVKHIEGYETRWSLSLVANQFCDYLEQWTEWKTSSISIY